MARFFWILFVLPFIEQVQADQPHPWQIGFQKAASPIMEHIVSMHNFLLVIIFAISIFVAALVFYVIYRFRASRNPIPSTVTHNTILEIVWTLVPVLVVSCIGIPSLKLMFFANHIPEAELTVKAIGQQWYWTYEYPDQKISFDSFMIEDKDLKPGQIRLLSVDREIVVPINKTVRIWVTSGDVLHSFAVPSLGIKKDAVPGRINETWFHIRQPGVYYGQCSELCGTKHGFMPIAVRAVPMEEYEKWVKANQGPAH